MGNVFTHDISHTHDHTHTHDPCSLARSFPDFVRGSSASVAKCRGSWQVIGSWSWVVGSRGSWVWVWVNVLYIKKKLSKKKNKNYAKSCKIHETKIPAYIPILFPFPAVSKANKRIL